MVALIRRRSAQYLDGRHQGEISDEDDAQLSGHVLHDGPALVAQTWTGEEEEGLLAGEKDEGDWFVWQSEVLDRPCAMRSLTSRSTGVETTDLVSTKTFSSPMTTTR